MTTTGLDSRNPADRSSLPYRLGVGAVLFNDAGLAWIGKRIPKPGQAIENYWQMPQGGIDENEDPAEAVFRELQEETGTDKAEIIAETDGWLTYDLPPDLLGVSWGGRFRGQAQKWFALRFTGSDGDFNLNAHEEPEFDAWKWTELASLPGLIVPFKKTMYEQVVTAFGDVPGRVRGKP